MNNVCPQNSLGLNLSKSLDPVRLSHEKKRSLNTSGWEEVGARSILEAARVHEHAQLDEMLCNF